ncbi:MAG: hypothetical protein RMJ35_03745 [Phycisphaerales bacterium]|nr:hypothetical protein [Phycisphaerales bacterium]
MAEKEPKKDKSEAGDKKSEGAKKGSFFTRLPVLLGGVMAIEAVVLIVGLKMLGFGKPKEVVAAELAEHEEHAESDSQAAHEDSSHASHGASGSAEKQKDKEADPAARKLEKRKLYELPLVEFRAPNKMSGRTFLYDISIYTMVRGENVDRVSRVLKEREALIKDRVRTIIAQSDPEKLGGGSEPGLETLRRQVKYQLDEIVGEGLVEEVLVPRCIPFRTDF